MMWKGDWWAQKLRPCLRVHARLREVIYAYAFACALQDKAKTKLPVNAFKSLCSRADGGDGTKVLLLCEGLQLP